MTGPARAGLFVYAKDMPRLAAFYADIAGLRPLHTTESLTVLGGTDLQLLVHRIAPDIAAAIAITVPPQRRDNTALKFFFSVPQLARAIERIEALGGLGFSSRWDGPGFVMCDACDPEGNVFQLREWRPT